MVRLDDGSRSGGGFVLHLSDTRSFQVKLGLGNGSNNSAELSAYKSLLSFSLQMGISRFEVYGDSLLVANWLRQAQQCRNIFLVPLVDEILQLKLVFTSFF